MNPQIAELALHNQWQNVLSILGYSILPRLIPYMVKFANALDRAAAFMQAHPSLTSGLVMGLAGVAVSLSLIGKVLMTAGIIKFLGLGPMLMSVAGGMGALATTVAVLGAKLGGLGLAAAGGYILGTGINMLGPGGDLGGWLGGKLYQAIHPYQPNQTVVHHTQVNLDGRKIAIVVTKHQADAAAHAPQSGGSSFNTKMHPYPAGGY
jgi:hypothetical protein